MALCCLFVVSEVLVTFHLTCVHIILVRFRLLSGHLLEKKAAHSVNHVLFCILTICNISYFPFWFLGLDVGSDCFSSWSLYTSYYCCHTSSTHMLSKHTITHLLII